MANFKLGLATAYSTFATGDRLYIEDVSEAIADQAKYVTIGTLDTRWQGLAANLTAIAGLTPSDGVIIVGDGSNFVAESGPTARTSLGLGSAAIADATDFATAAQGALADSAVQPGDLAAVAYSGDYSDLSGLPSLGTIAAQNANSVSITGGAITGITDLAIADGGTGQSTAQAAINALSQVAAATNEYVLTKDTASGDALWKAAAGGGSSLPVVDETAIVYKTGQPTFTVTLDADALTAARTKTLQNTAATLAELETAQTFTGEQTFTGGLLAYRNGVTTNFIAGGAGNVAMSGSNIVAIGPLAMNSVTSGNNSFAIGNSSAKTMSTAVEVFALGVNTYQLGNASYVTLIGNNTLRSYNATGSARIVAIGDSVAFHLTGGIDNTLVGSGSFYNVSGTRNRNTAVGREAGASAPVSDCLYLGNRAGKNATRDHTLIIANAETTTPLIYGEFDNSILKFHSTVNSDAVVDTAQLVRRRSSGTPGSGIGSALRYGLHTSTTEDQTAARIVSAWNVATHASAVADVYAEAYYNGGGGMVSSEIWRGRGGSSPAFAVLGATPAQRQAHIADPSGGGTQDAEARAAIVSILDVLETFGYVAS